MNSAAILMHLLCIRNVIVYYTLLISSRMFVKFGRCVREHDNGGLNVRFYGRTQRRASRRGTAPHGMARHGTLDGTAKRTHPRSRVRGIRTINRFTWHARFGRRLLVLAYAPWMYRVIRIKRAGPVRISCKSVSNKPKAGSRPSRRAQMRIDHLLRWTLVTPFSC